MQVKVEFSKIGLGCDYCAAKSKENCPSCERNPGLMKLKDNFKRLEKPPAFPMKDDSGGDISDVNRAELAGWGIRVPPAAPKPPPTPKEPPRASEPPPALNP